MFLVLWHPVRIERSHPSHGQPPNRETRLERTSRIDPFDWVSRRDDHQIALHNPLLLRFLKVIWRGSDLFVFHSLNQRRVSPSNPPGPILPCSFRAKDGWVRRPLIIILARRSFVRSFARSNRLEKHRRHERWSSPEIWSDSTTEGKNQRRMRVEPSDVHSMTVTSDSKSTVDIFRKRFPGGDRRHQRADWWANATFPDSIFNLSWQYRWTISIRFVFQCLFTRFCLTDRDRD